MWRVACNVARLWVFPWSQSHFYTYCREHWLFIWTSFMDRSHSWRCLRHLAGNRLLSGVWGLTRVYKRLSLGADESNRHSSPTCTYDLFQIDIYSYFKICQTLSYLQVFRLKSTGVSSVLWVGYNVSRLSYHRELLLPRYPLATFKYHYKQHVVWNGGSHPSWLRVR